MTKKERKIRAETKKKLQEEGILPPDKKRLNRKKFIDEAISEWNKRDKGLLDDVYLIKAIGIMTGHVGRRLNPTLEAVGAAKVVRLAMRLKQFEEEMKAEGKEQYSIGEMHEYIKDILEA